MVSVVMPVYNAGKTLSGAIESILNQSYTDFEFVIVDDGSTDRSYEIMLEYARDDKRIKIVRSQQNQGIPFARNAGLDAVTRKYIAVMDADDISLPQRLQVEVDFLEYNIEFGVVVSNAFYVNEDMETIDETGYPQCEITLSDLILKNPIVAGTAMFRSDCIAQVGKYAPYDWAEDYELWIRFARQYKIKQLQNYLYQHRVSVQPKISYPIETFLQKIAQAYQQITNTINPQKPSISPPKPLIKIVLACNHLSTGGCPAYVLSQIQALKQNSPENYEIYVFEKGYAGINHIRNVIQQESDHFFTNDEISLSDLVKKENIDIVHYHGWNTIEDRPSQGYSIQTVHTTNPALCQEIAQADIDRVLLMNSEQKQYFPKGTIISSPIDTEQRFNPSSYNQQEMKEKIGVPINQPFVLNIGIFTPNKCQKDLLELWNLNDVTLGFLGPLADNFRSYWVPIYQQYNQSPNIHFFDAQANPEEYFAAADIYIAPSKVEACSLATLEAMSMQKPIVAHDIEANRAILTDNQTGLLRTLDESFIDSVKMLLKSPKFSQSLGENARNEILNKHSYKMFAHKIDDIFQQRILNDDDVQQLPEKLSEIDYVLDFNNHPIIFVKTNGKYHVKIKNSQEQILYSTDIKKTEETYNIFVSANLKVWDEYIFEIQHDGEIIIDQLDGHKKTFLIKSDSPALGDNIAWLPYYFQFAKKHQATVYVQTPFNSLFQHLATDNVKFNHYPAPDFIVSIGLYSQNMKNDWQTIPLQQIATDFLGLDFEEKRIDLSGLAGDRQIDDKYVCIAPKASFVSKEWNYDGGWQQVVDWIINQGYKVVWISAEPCNLQNVIDKSGYLDLQDRLTDLYYADYCLSVSSGLSWLAWAVGTPVFMISGFTHDWQEFQSGITRISRQDVCRGCFHEKEFDMIGTIDNLCPRGKDFECTKSITPDQVIEAIKKPHQPDDKNDIINAFKIKSITPNQVIEAIKKPHQPDDKDDIINAFKIPEGRDGNFIINEIFNREVYTQKFDIDINDVVVDIGASIGISSVYAAQKTQNTVYALEPHPDNYQYLLQNTANYPNIISKNVAVTHINGEMPLFEGHDCGQHTIYNRSGTHLVKHTGRTIITPSKTLQKIVDENNIDNIDFLKMDCEGSEGVILLSISQSLFKRINKIALEYHDNISALQHDEIVNLLQKNGFKTVIVEEGSFFGYIYAWRGKCQI